MAGNNDDFDVYMGAGEDSLMDHDTLTDNGGPQRLPSPTAFFDEIFGAGGDDAPMDTHPPAPAPQPAALALPQVPTDPALLGQDQSANPIQNQGVFMAPPQGQPAPIPGNGQGQYPLGPLQGGNDANQAVAGNGFPPTVLPSQYGFLNMQPQYSPQVQGPTFGAPNTGFQGYGNVPAPVPYLQMPGYLPSPGAPNPFQPRQAVFSQPMAPFAQPPLAPLPQPQPPASVAGPSGTNAPARPEGKLNHHRQFKNKERNNPGDYYTAPTGLCAWGPKVGKNKEHLFQYYRKTAELTPGASFSKEQLVLFFRGRGHPNPNRRLTLWIQNTAAQANNRYAAGSQSSKCRWEGCPGGSRTILKGFFRVAFDEASDLTGTVNDPLHNAGYMHLHCFEKLFDLGYLIHYGAARHGFQILPDTREFPYETKNPAALTRDHKDMIQAYNEWVAVERHRVDRIEAMNAIQPPEHRYTGFDPINLPPHAQRLGCKLTEKHLSSEVKARSAKRQSRGGAHIGLHKGDLELYEQLKRDGKKRKRKAREEEEEDDDDDDDEDSAEGDEGENMGDEIHVAGEEDEVIPRGTRSRPARDSRSNGPGSGGPASPPRKRAKTDQTTPNNKGKDPDFDELYDATPRQSPVRGAPPLPYQLSFPAIPQPQGFSGAGPGGPRTRKRSRETSEDILAQLTAGSHLTRSSAHAIQARLGSHPPHVQNEVLAAVPEYAAVFDPQQQQRDAAQCYRDNLEQRLGRLSKRQRREVEEFVERREKRTDGRKGHSF